jgi:hypothetical protein
MYDEILDELIARGVSAPTLKAVMRLIAEAESLRDRREVDRERKQRWRDGHVTSRSVPGRPRTSQDNPPSIEERKIRKEVSKEGRKRPLPPDFQPDLAWAMEKRKWTSEEAAAEAERFRYHYLASGTPWVDWQCVWRKWVTSPFQQKGNGNGNGHAPRPHSREDREERTGIALAKLRAYARGGGEAGRQTTLGLPEPEEPA